MASNDGAVERLHGLALTRSPTLGTARLVAVDGPAGSGKSTLARELSGRLNDTVATATVQMDDLYDGWAGLDASIESRVVGQLLAPLAAGRESRYQRYDWDAGRFDGWVTVPPVEVLVLEGCGAGARAYASYTTLLVWVEAAEEVRIRRGIARDGASVLPEWLSWMERENRYFAANQTRERAAVRLVTG